MTETVKDIKKRLVREAKKRKKQRHRLALGTILCNDRSYVSKLIDIDTERGWYFDGRDYKVPDIPYRLLAWWPFKARSLKRAIIKDQYYNIDWIEGDPTAISITSAHDRAEHKYILPSTFAAMLKENMFGGMINSMKRKNKLPLETKWIVLIIIIVAIGILAAMTTGIVPI